MLPINQQTHQFQVLKMSRMLKMEQQDSSITSLSKVTRYEHKRLIKSLTEENQKLWEEKDFYKRLFEISQQNQIKWNFYYQKYTKNTASFLNFIYLLLRVFPSHHMIIIYQSSTNISTHHCKKCHISKSSKQIIPSNLAYKHFN